MEEIEIKYLDIDRVDIEQKLINLGATKVGDYHYRRVVFDYPDFRLDKDASWVRLRDEGDKITLSFKKRLGESAAQDKSTGNDEGMYERETVVINFEATRDILLKIGLIEKMYQENKRTRYVLDDIEFDIDTWPLLNPYLEIEGPSWEKVYEASEKIGFNREEAKIFSTNQIYRLQGLDDRNYIKLTFTEQVERVENKF